MTYCGLLKENAPKNLALPDNIFFSEEKHKPIYFFSKNDLIKKTCD